jgi:hypothetical protein
MMKRHQAPLSHEALNPPVPTVIQESSQALFGYQPSGAFFMQILSHSRNLSFWRKNRFFGLFCGFRENGFLALRYIPKPAFTPRAHGNNSFNGRPLVVAPFTIKYGNIYFCHAGDGL